MRCHIFIMGIPILVRPWGRLNIKMLPYQYRDPHVKDKLTNRLIFNMGITIPGKDGLYIEMVSWCYILKVNFIPTKYSIYTDFNYFSCQK